MSASRHLFLQVDGGSHLVCQVCGLTRLAVTFGGKKRVHWIASDGTHRYQHNRNPIPCQCVNSDEPGVKTWKTQTP